MFPELWTKDGLDEIENCKVGQVASMLRVIVFNGSATVLDLQCLLTSRHHLQSPSPEQELASDGTMACNA